MGKVGRLETPEQSPKLCPGGSSCSSAASAQSTLVLHSHSSSNFPQVFHNPDSPSQLHTLPEAGWGHQAPLVSFLPLLCIFKPLIVLHLKPLPPCAPRSRQDAGGAQHPAVPQRCPNMVPHRSSVARHYFIPRICNTPIYTF